MERRVKQARPFGRRLPGMFEANCNGLHSGDSEPCGFRILPTELRLVEVTTQARTHAREHGHETVVTLTALTVYDGRPKGQRVP